MASRARRLLAAGLVPAAAFAAIVLAIHWRLWTPIDGARRAFAWDAVWEYWGDLQFPLDALRAGELPLWNPYDRCGYPFHADPQAGLLYPPNWLLWLLGLVAGPAWWLAAVKAVLHFWLAGLGLYAYCRRRGLPRAAAYGAGVLFILAYPFTHAMPSALNWGMAWAPWLLLALDAWAERPAPRGAAGVALAFGLCVLAGGAAAAWYTLLLAAPYAIWAVVHHGRARPAEERRAYARAAAVSAAIAAGLVLGMLAAQLDATGRLVGLTVREHRDLGFIGTTAFSADDLFGMLVPRMPGEGAYVGIAAVLWIAAALSMRPDARRLVLGGVAVFGVLCAWGSSGAFLPLSASVAPPFGFFRRAHRYLYVTMPALAILGAEGLAALAALEGEELRRRAGRMILGAGALLAAVFAVGVVVHSKSVDKAGPYRDPFALAFAATVVSAWVTRQVVASDGTMRRVFLGIAAVVLSLDLWYARAEAIERNWQALPVTPHDREARGLAGVPLEARLYDRSYLSYRPGIRLGVRDFGGYEGDPLALRRYALLRDAFQASPAKVGHAAVRWLLEAKPSRSAGLEPLRAGGGGISEVAVRAPMVMWADRAAIVDGGEEAAARALLGRAAGSAVVLERARLGGGELARRAAEGAADAPVVAGRIVSASRNRLVAEIDAPADGIVVVHEAYYPGWRARVDGAAAPIVPANVLFRGVFVPAGRHRIEMVYGAPRFLAAAALSPLALAAALLLLLRRGRTA